MPRRGDQVFLTSTASVFHPAAQLSPPLLAPLRVKAAIRATSDGRPTSDFRPLCQQQSVLHVDTKISDRVLDLGVTEQDLDGADVARRLLDHGRLRATERVSAIFLLA